ncbi:MAG TPA: efflux RND transporter periplasmic adaptor subunit [Methylomirabilota bacterium]|nr:efflux RND transporter periplasmic adaptor subunit [Methylomirabilota bacterium]
MSKNYLAVLSLTLLSLLAACGKQRQPPAAPPAPAVTTALPIAQKVTEWDEFTGRLASPETVDVRARVSGYIDKVHFKEGADVQQGDLLFTIDRRPYQAAVDRAKAEVGAARARAELARGEAKRAENLAASKAISTDAYETRVKTAAQADEALLAAEAAARSAELELEFTQVRAAITGRISNARVTSGNLITGGNTQNATLLTTIVSLDPLYCYFEADEASALRYRQWHREGKRTSALFGNIPAEMALGNEQGFPHKGQVDFVDNQVNPATGTIRARAVFENPDRLMAPGFFARVRIPGVAEYEGLLIRDSAIGSDQGRPYVLVVGSNDVAVARNVKTGPIVNGLRVVREGLQSDDRVIVTGLMSARPGLKVAPQGAPMSTNAILASSQSQGAK